MPNFEMANQEVEEIARDLIQKYHEHLVNAKICYLFRFGSWTSKGKIVFGQAKKTSEKEKLITGFDFIITLNGDKWPMMPFEVRKAVLDHELCHCGVEYDINGEPKINEEGEIVYKHISHDVEEFAAVIRRHGLYNNSIQQFMTVAKQLSIFDLKEAS